MDEMSLVTTPRHNGENVSIVRREFGAVEVARQAELAAVAAAAKEEALVKARFTMAIHRPRSLGDARLRMISACKRSRFAKVARYAKPQGKKKDPDTGRWEQNFVVGWSIRAAEEFARAFGNIDVQESVIFDDAKQRIIRVTAIDLESNYATTKEVIVAKSIERSTLKKGQVALGERLNSYGDTVYLVEPTDDELATKVNAALSKARRNAILALVPGDLLDEALDVVTETAQADDTKDPGSATRKLADAFIELGVKPSQLEQLLGHGLDLVSEKERAQLRNIYTAIKDGEAKWSDFVDTDRDPVKLESQAPVAKPAAVPTAPVKEQPSSEEHSAAPKDSSTKALGQLEAWREIFESSWDADEVKAAAQQIAQAEWEVSKQDRKLLQSLYKAAVERIKKADAPPPSDDRVTGEEG